jgi:hypothetical protein
MTSVAAGAGSSSEGSETSMWTPEPYRRSVSGLPQHFKSAPGSRRQSRDSIQGDDEKKGESPCEPSLCCELALQHGTDETIT